MTVHNKSSSSHRDELSLLDLKSQSELSRRRRHDRVLKIKKLRSKHSSYMLKPLRSAWSPFPPFSDDLHDLNSSDSENEQISSRGCANRGTVKSPESRILDNSQLTRQERNRLSARASRDKKNSEIVTLSSRVEFFEQENQNLIAFLSQLPQSVLQQIHGSESILLSSTKTQGS
jgi:hypothetical protein